jgi:peptidoglycan/xylan/chitin deacetylase (PgdA/CDA1 family)
VLERLAKYNLTAAFFLVGKRIADPALVTRIAAAGHTLGNHTFSHAVPRLGDIAMSLADVARSGELVPEAKLFRPPLGRLTPGLWLAARRHGLRVMNWSLDSGDWRCRSAADAATCAAEVMRLVRPDDIVLFHALGRDELRRITRLLLAGTAQRLAAQRIELVVTDGAVDWLAEHGHEPELGARPLRRTINRELERKLARMIIGSRAGAGQRVTVDVSGGVRDGELQGELGSAQLTITVTDG